MPSEKKPTTVLGEMVRAARKERDMSQAALGKAAGLSRGAIQDMEGGPPQRDVPMRKVLAVVKVLNLPLPDVLAAIGPRGLVVPDADLLEAATDEEALLAVIRKLPDADRRMWFAIMRQTVDGLLGSQEDGPPTAGQSEPPRLGKREGRRG